MTEPSEAVKMISAIETAAPQAFGYKSDEEYAVLVRLWCDCFKEYKKEAVWAAVRSAILNGEYARQNWLAAVNRELARLCDTPQKSDVELWEELADSLPYAYRNGQYLQYVSNAYMRDSYDRARRDLARGYADLSEDIRLYVPNVRSWVRLANEPTENLLYERARFLKMLPELRKHKKDRRAADQFLGLLSGKKDTPRLAEGEKRK